MTLWLPRAGAAACVGDCDGDGRVTVAELIRGVGIILGLQQVGQCAALDCQQTRSLPVNCLVQGVNNLLGGCPLEPVAFAAGLDAQGPALRITPAAALRAETVYAVVLTSGITDGAGRPLQASAAFRALTGGAESTGDGPVALFESDLDAPGNPYPDDRLVEGDSVRIPDRFALRGLPDTPPLALARGLLRTTADEVGGAGLFSTTAPIRVALSDAVD